MQIEQFIPWEDDEEEEFIFPSHTSIISIDLIVEKMQEQGKNVEMPSSFKKRIQDVDVSFESG